MKRTIGIVLIGVLAAMAAVVTGSQAASADTTPVAFTCDLPAAQGGVAAGLIPDTVPLNNDVTINDTPDPVAPGGSVHYDLDVPFPDLTGDLPDLGFPLGYFYVRSIDITQPIPAGLDLNSVTASLSPDPSWASVSRVGSNLVIHIQSAYPTVNDTNGRIRINADVTPTTVEVQETNGTWVPINFVPSVDIDATVTGAPGSTIDWKAPSILAKVFYKKFIIIVININWNDVNTPCTPDNPNQTVVSTLVGSPGLSVSTSADETSVVAGQPIHLHVTATNTGNMALTGVTVSDPNAPGCAGSPGTLAVGASVTIDCTVTTSAANIPTFSNSASADSNETAPASSNTVNVTITAPGPSGVSGTITTAGSGTPIGGAWVALLSTSNFAIAGGAVADGAGNFEAAVPAGSYYLYLVDPAGGHATGFWGPPTAVNVTNGTVTDADPTMATSLGTIAGTVSEDGTGNPVPGAFAIGMSASTGKPGTTATANGSGQYSIPNLSVGNRRVVYVDPAGNHRSEFFANSPDFGSATNVAVAAGQTAPASVSLATQTPNAGGTTLSGTVTETGTGTPLAGVQVIALRASDFALARGTTTNGSGSYSLSVSAGDYRLAFVDSAGTHDAEWHNDHSIADLAASNSVTSPSVVDAGLARNTGSMSGTITDDPSGTPLEGAWVVAINPTTGAIVGGAVTAANGTYTLSGLPAGTYRATIVDPLGGRTQEYWNNSPTFPGSSPIVIAGGQTTTINAALALP